MNIYLGIKYYSDMRNKKTIEMICEAFNFAGHTTFCVVRDVEGWGDTHYSPSELMVKTFAMINQCDLVVIELSEKGVGLGIEAGYAYSLGIPVITVAKKGSDISTTLKGISTKVGFYNTIEEIPRLLEKAIEL